MVTQTGTGARTPRASILKAAVVSTACFVYVTVISCAQAPQTDSADSLVRLHIAQVSPVVPTPIEFEVVERWHAASAQRPSLVVRLRTTALYRPGHTIRTIDFYRADTAFVRAFGVRAPNTEGYITPTTSRSPARIDVVFPQYADEFVLKLQLTPLTSLYRVSVTPGFVTTRAIGASPATVLVADSTLRVVPYSAGINCQEPEATSGCNTFWDSVRTFPGARLIQVASAVVPEAHQYQLAAPRIVRRGPTLFPVRPDTVVRIFIGFEAGAVDGLHLLAARTALRAREDLTIGISTWLGRRLSCRRRTCSERAPYWFEPVGGR